MDREEFYQLMIDGEVDTYTRAEWSEEMGEHVHQLITPEEYAKAKADGKTVREVTL